MAFRRTFGLFTTVLLCCERSEACAVCYGNPDDIMVKSANAGVAFLLAVVLGVLVAFGSVFFRWYRRSQLISR